MVANGPKVVSHLEVREAERKRIPELAGAQCGGEIWRTSGGVELGAGSWASHRRTGDLPGAEEFCSVLESDGNGSSEAQKGPESRGVLGC